MVMSPVSRALVSRRSDEHGGRTDASAIHMAAKRRGGELLVSTVLRQPGIAGFDDIKLDGHGFGYEAVGIP